MPAFKTINGGAVIVDSDDAHLLSCPMYRVKGTNSTYVSVIVSGRKLRLSRVITDAPRNLVVDHVNGNPLDNRRANLRLCTIQENNWNRRRRAGGSSKYKGVSLLPGGAWKATIYPNGQQIHLGRFRNEEEAALAYDDAARLHYGEFACVNFPQDEVRTAIHDGDNTHDQ